MSEAARNAHQIRLQAGLHSGLIGRPKVGLITSYDPKIFAAKVKLQPEDVETGFLPILSLMAGNDFGIQAAPSPGDQVLVLFEEGDREAGWIVGSAFSDEDRPAAIEAGEIRIKSRGGASITFTKAGKMVLSAPQGFELTGDVKITGKVEIEGDVTTTGKIEADGVVKSGTISLTTHKHPGVSPGPSQTGIPV